MSQLALVKTQGGALVPLTDDDKAVVDKKRVGSVIECSFKTVRNPMFHRKYFALLNLGFDYWTPKGGTVSPSERSLLSKFVQMLAQYGGELQTLQDLASGYLDNVSSHRANLEVEKDFYSYRKWVVVEAGYYNIVTLPNGAVKKEAKSISFAKMDEDEFSSLFRSSFNVIWNHILHQYFEDESECQRVIDRMMQYL